MGGMGSRDDGFVLTRAISKRERCLCHCDGQHATAIDIGQCNKGHLNACKERRH